jgi:rhodanese-related sulfurtransferase
VLFEIDHRQSLEGMLSIAFVLVSALAQANANDGLRNSLDNLVGKMVNRVSPLKERKDLDGTTMGKASLAAIPQRAPLVPRPGLSRGSQGAQPQLQCYTWSKSAHAMRAVHLSATPGKEITTRTATAPDDGSLEDLQPGSAEGQSTPEEVKWPTAYRSLVDRGLQSVTGEDAMKMVKEDGAVICDVREEKYFLQGTPEGALNVPLFEPVQGNSFRAWNKRLQGAALGIGATDRNPSFVADAKEMLPRDKPVIVICARGGVVDDKYDPRKFRQDSGRYTTSLKAAYELYEGAGFKNVYFVEGGFNKWYADDLPMEYYPE